MKTIASCTDETESTLPEERGFDPIGLTIVAVLPALFWTIVISQVAYAFGLNLSMMLLGLIAGAIGVFLTAVYAAIVTAAKAPVTRSI